MNWGMLIDSASGRNIRWRRCLARLQTGVRTMDQPGLNRLRAQDRDELGKLLQRIKGQKEKARDATTTCSKTKPRQMMLAFALSLTASTSAAMVSTSDEKSGQ
jgi:hypothetical protein